MSAAADAAFCAELVRTYDFDRYFARVASDPHVNFSREHMIRLALGVRF